MGNNRVVLYLVLAYFFVMIAGQGYLFLRLSSLSEGPESIYTAKASGELKFCYNHEPYINNTCNFTMYQDEYYECDIIVDDEDGDGIIYYLETTDNSTFTEIRQDGEFRAEPNSTDVGNHTGILTVWDDSGCSNSMKIMLFTIEVLNINDPPYLYLPIPNQTWEQDTSLVAIDLDNHFSDYDGDPLNYTYELLENIQVQIDSDNTVTFTPISGWSGTEEIVFFAWDPYLANGSSNTVILTIQPTIEPPEPSTGGGSSGGGSSSGYVPSCIPRWYCRPWGPCEPDGFMYRECYDLNNCSNDFGKPNTTETCEFISTCYDGFQGPEEEGIDCGGPCPPCGNCYDSICNNGEDCVYGLTDLPDCGGSCKACAYPGKESCYDSICNNGEDCVYGLTDLPDCGGPCEACPVVETPALVKAFNWALLVMAIMSIILTGYLVSKAYPQFRIASIKRRRKKYEETLLLEAKISESIFDSLTKLEELMDTEDIEKLLMMFSMIVRRYFKSLFKLDYEFTYEEIISEINSKRITDVFKSVLTKFFERSLELEFSGKSVGRQEIGAMVSEFKQLLSLTSEEAPEAKKVKKEEYKGKSKIDKLFNQISQAEAHLARAELNEAYFIYIRARADFNMLSRGEKEKFHGFLSRLYDEIRLAREKYDSDNNGKA